MSTKNFSGTMIYPNGDGVDKLTLHIVPDRNYYANSNNVLIYNEVEEQTNSSGVYNFNLAYGVYNIFVEKKYRKHTRLYIGRLKVDENTTATSLIEAMEA